MVLCCVCCVADESQNEGSWYQHFEVWEIITELVVGLIKKKICLEMLRFFSKKRNILCTYEAVWLLEPHSIDNKCSGGDEEDLHEGVVD